MKYLILILLLMSSLLSQNINVGMTTALSGPAKALGQNMKAGIELAFKEENQLQNEYKFNLIALNDGYEPIKASINMRKLIDEKNVLAVIGNVGTPTASVTVPIANKKGVLLFGAFSGAGILRNTPPDRYIINYRASYAQETAAMINGLLDNGIKAEEIAFFTQNDGYGDAGYFGAVKALVKRGFSNINQLSHGRYDRNTLNVEDGLITILDSEIEPKAIIIVGAYAPVAEFIKIAKEDFPDTLFLNVSFVGSNALKNKLKDDSQNVIITQVVPLYNSQIPIVKSYNKSLNKFNKKEAPSFVSLEGYIVGKLFTQNIKKMKTKKITRESIIDSFEDSEELDIGLSFVSNFSKNKHQYSNKVWTTVIKDNEFINFEWSELKKF